MERRTAFKLSALICILLSGCAGTVPENAPPETPAGISETKPGAYGPLEKYDPSITLTRVIKTEANQKFFEGDTYEDNVWTREIENTLGIKLKTLWSTDVSQYKQKLDLAIGSGDIPDFFATADNDYNALVDCYSSGLITPLDDAYNHYAGADFKSHQDYFPAGLQACRFNGKLYAIPDTTTTPGILSSLLWIRDDWMKKLNLAVPATMNDVLAIAEAFTKNDPDGNGKPDTFGLGIQNTLAGSAGEIKGFALGYHAFLDGMWIQSPSGQYIYGAVQPEAKNALAALRDMYKNGLIDKEFGVKDINNLFEDMNNNKIGMTFGLNWLCYQPFQGMVNADRNNVWRPYPIPPADEAPVKNSVPWPIPRYFMVSKNCKYPEAILKMVNLFLVKAGVNASEEDLKTFDISGDIDIYKLHPLAMEPPGREFTETNAIIKALGNPGDALNIKPYFKDAYANAKKWIDGDTSGYGDYFFYGPNGANWIIQNEYVKNGRIAVNVSKGADTPAMVDKYPTLNKMQNETFIKIIMGEPLDNFDKFVTDWGNLGGNDMTKEINDLLGK